ncbi:MAG: hypothetical protein L0G09_10070 [Acinetobacter sp.]|nr:hypothetical protein [Acinetobacter sp.]MDN5434269.1 hypothetical protein [Acinetobacter sp.]MDN5622852.1 hypothetical protein [Acinetobacter sp.]MDN5691493.1 hypothetical protein [Acinetobacter sp.]
MENKEQFEELAIRIGFDIYEENGEFFYAETRMAFELFQAAKSQATPEGFVLVPKILSNELNDHLWDFMTDNFISTNEDGDSYIACDDFDLGKFYSEIIEAQEQSHDNSN